MNEFQREYRAFDKAAALVVGLLAVLFMLLALSFAAREAHADRLGEAIPEGGCVLCWDGDTQIGYSRSGKCKSGEAAVVSSSPVLCSGNDLTVSASGVRPFIGHPVLSALFRDARADTGPVCGVHYSTRLEEAEKHFIGAGFQDIRRLRYMDLPAVIQGRASRGNLAHCNDARVLVRRWDREGQCTSFYQGDTDWSSTPCNVYGFEAKHYIGPRGNLGRDGR